MTALVTVLVLFCLQPGSSWTASNIRGFLFQLTLVKQLWRAPLYLLINPLVGPLSLTSLSVFTALPHGLVPNSPQMAVHGSALTEDNVRGADNYSCQQSPSENQRGVWHYGKLLVTFELFLGENAQMSICALQGIWGGGGQICHVLRALSICEFSLTSQLFKIQNSVGQR